MLRVDSSDRTPGQPQGGAMDKQVPEDDRAKSPRHRASPWRATEGAEDHAAQRERDPGARNLSGASRNEIAGTMPSHTQARPPATTFITLPSFDIPRSANVQTPHWGYQ